jgi:hypothetical protein
MSNFLYDAVDLNLQAELNARATSGLYNKSTKDLQFMIEKIANAQVVAYSGNNSGTDPVYSLGGFDVRSGRFMPNDSKQNGVTTSGYLSDFEGTRQVLQFDESGRAYNAKTTVLDQSKRVAPFLTSVDIQIGDGSMGLLNKASVSITIPNPLRDLDTIETVFFRPGRYIQILIEHPDSAVITRDVSNPGGPDGQGGLLSKSTIPNADKLKEFYPNLSEEGVYNEFELNLRKLNRVTFEGLITSFDFSYQTDGSITATLSVTGTSNVYSDISMYLNNDASQENEEEVKNKKRLDENPSLDPKIDIERKRQVLDQIESGSILLNKSGPELIASASQMGATPDVLNELRGIQTESTSSSQFFDALWKDVQTTVSAQDPLDKEFNSNLLPVSLITSPDPTPDNPETNGFILYGAAKPSSLAKQLSELPNGFSPDRTERSSYITLGYLIDFINNRILSRLQYTVEYPKILCSDAACYSNYIPDIVSAYPREILLLDTLIAGNTMNSYGDSVFFNVDKMKNADQWPGVKGVITHSTNGVITTGNEAVIFPSRILINLQTIRSIILGDDGKGGLSSGGKKSFGIKLFLTSISSKISAATGRLVSLSLQADKTDPNILLFLDKKYVKSKAPKAKKIIPYSVPLFQNQGGAIAHSFTLSAKLPESVKNLSYVLNQDKDVSEEDIAPYIKFMYETQDAEGINKGLEQYKKRHTDAVNALESAKKEYGIFEGNPEKEQALYKALFTYVKYPTDDIKISNLMSAPIFPFVADFEIDGINGFRYGDVLQFDALPKRYTTNTVFSVIGVNHTVSVDGQWKTSIKTIMRPSIE